MEYFQCPKCGRIYTSATAVLLHDCRPQSSALNSNFSESEALRIEDSSDCETCFVADKQSSLNAVEDGPATALPVSSRQLENPKKIRRNDIQLALHIGSAEPHAVYDVLETSSDEGILDVDALASPSNQEDDGYNHAKCIARFPVLCQILDADQAAAYGMKLMRNATELAKQDLTKSMTYHLVCDKNVDEYDKGFEKWYDLNLEEIKAYAMKEQAGLAPKQNNVCVHGWH